MPARWSLVLPVIASLFVPLTSYAQNLKVLASGTSLNVRAENSTSYIEVIGLNAGGGQTYVHRCEPNVQCIPPQVAGTTSSSSRLMYDATRERLTNCNNVPTSPTDTCEKLPGIVTATTQVRMGKLKISAKADTGYAGLTLSTPGASVRLQFVDSPDDHWTFGYSNRNFGAANEYQNVPAGQYRVIAADLPSHCHPTQTNTDLVFTVPEYMSEADQRELVVLFRGNLCEVSVTRSAAEGVSIGSLSSSPAGLECAAGAGACKGTFPFDTKVTLTPSGGYSWTVGQGCTPTNAPCNITISSDRVFTLRYNSNVSVDPMPQDAGVPVGSTDAAVAQPQDASVGMGLADAGGALPQPDGASGLPQADAAEDKSGGGGCAMGGTRQGGGGYAGVVFALASALLLRRRRTRLDSTPGA